MSLQHVSDHSATPSLVTEWHLFILEQTCTALAQSGLCQDSDIEQIRHITLRRWHAGDPADPLFSLAKLQETDDLLLGNTVEQLSSMLAFTVAPTMVPAPFASQMMTPSTFYDKYEPLADMARSIMCPVLYNEDADVIGIGSINPITVSIFAQAISAYIKETCAVQPLISIVRLTHPAWETLLSRHFAI